MRIAINTRFLLPHKMEGFGWYTYEIVSRMVKNHPEHEFFFFFDRSFDPKFIFANNVTPVVLRPPARHPFLFYIWFELSVTRALKKLDIDLFFSPDGYLSLKTDIPQICTIHDLNFEHNPKDLTWMSLKYYRFFFPKFAKKAKHILTVSEYSKQDITKTYNIPADKITPVWNGASDIFKPILEEHKKTIQLKYSKGKEFFLFVGALSPRKNVKRLVEAFAEFKKQAPENEMQLVIVGEELWKNANDIDINEQVRNQIHFTGHLPIEELANIMASALVFTYVPYFEGFGIPLVEAMKCGTPILSGNLTSLPEVGGDAVAYCNPYDVEDIANQMKLLSNDGAMRKELSSKGLERSQLFSWELSAVKVWNVIEEYL